MKTLSEKEAVTFLEKILFSPEDFKTSKELGATVFELADFWRKNYRSKYMDGVDGAPDWLEFEHRLWQLGENLRSVIRKMKLKGENGLLDAAAKILIDSSFGKGRQTFALLLGEFGQGNYSKILGAVLDDGEVRGHAIKALIRARIGGFEEPVRNVLNNSSGWIKKEANKYLAKFGR